MKRFMIICMVAGFLCAFVAVISSVIIDPYNVFHVDNVRDNGIEPNKNYIKISYLIKNPNKFDSIIVGSSHIGALHVENMAAERCYNMTCPESLPCEEFDNLKSLISGGYKPDKIYLGVDSWSFRGDPEIHIEDKRTIPYELLQSKVALLREYIDPHNALFSLFTSLRHTKNPNFQSEFYDYGWMIDYDMQSEYDWNNLDEYESGVTNRMNETLCEIEKYVSYCEAEGIDLTIFINPYCAEEFGKDLEHGYMGFLENLAKIHPYYNFAGVNEYTLDHSYFIDPSHYNAYLGDKILSVIIGESGGDEENGWGVYVDSSNFEMLKSTMLKNKVSVLQIHHPDAAEKTVSAGAFPGSLTVPEVLCRPEKSISESTHSASLCTSWNEYPLNPASSTSQKKKILKKYAPFLFKK